MENFNDSILEDLSNVERIKKLSPEKAKEELIHIAEQFKNRYKYLVGEWKNAKRAKSTETGLFIKKIDVIDYLDND
jgi:CRISPR/Cas system-associated protein endoribonuclease Cas2